MADEMQEGLDDQSEQPQGLTEEVEQPEGFESQSEEQPITQSAVESDSESGDSELGNLYADLEKDIPEALKPHALNTKKRIQAYVTKKLQAHSQELDGLRKNQITPEFRSEFEKMYSWVDKLQKNPQAGLRELASFFQVDPSALGVREVQPQKDELTLQQVIANPTAENWAAFNRQESRKIVEDFREKEVRPLLDTLTELKGGSERRMLEEHGAKVLKEAQSLPGFMVEKEGKKFISPMAQQAVKLVLDRQFTGPEAIERAFFYLQGKEAPKKLKEFETQITTLKQNVKGATPPPVGQTQKTKPQISGSVEDRWNQMRGTPLS